MVVTAQSSYRQWIQDCKRSIDAELFDIVEYKGGQVPDAQEGKVAILLTTHEQMRAADFIAPPLTNAPIACAVIDLPQQDVPASNHVSWLLRNALFNLGVTATPIFNDPAAIVRLTILLGYVQSEKQELDELATNALGPMLDATEALQQSLDKGEQLEPHALEAFVDARQHAIDSVRTLRASAFIRWTIGSLKWDGTPIGTPPEVQFNTHLLVPTPVKRRAYDLVMAGLTYHKDTFPVSPSHHAA